MEPHIIELPRKILVGRDASGKIPELLKALGIEGRVLILADRTTREIAGGKIQDLLAGKFEAGLEPVRESSLKEAERIRKSCNEPDCIIGVGGGSVIDVGKKISSDLNSAFISVPTAPSHDGIASERISLTDGRIKHSLRGNPPTAIVADIEILMNAPYRLIASGCADAISNYTAVYDWMLARDRGEYYSEYAGNLALLSARTVMKSAKLISQKKERGIRNLVEALISSGISMSLVGSSRPASGAEHMFSHALDLLNMKAEASSCSSVVSRPRQSGTRDRASLARDLERQFKRCAFISRADAQDVSANNTLRDADISASSAKKEMQTSVGRGRSRALHGEQCGLGSILMAKLQGQDWRMIRDKLKLIGAPVTIKELNTNKETIIRALLGARKIRKRYTILDKKPLTEEKALELCRATGVL